MERKPPRNRRLLSLVLSLQLALSPLGGVSVALADEQLAQNAEAANTSQPSSIADASADYLAGSLGIEDYLEAYGAQPQESPDQPANTPNHGTSLETAAVTNATTTVSVGIPSMANEKKDTYVNLEYTDNFFNQNSSIYNDDLAYASICLAAASGNSNEGGENYASKSKNIISFMQQIGCKDVQVNDGYKAIPTELANIGVAVGYKDIKVDAGNYRLFVIGVRGISYMGEWAGNLRIGTSGNHQGFQEARDGVLGFVMPYIKSHVQSGQNVKIWISGFSRAGATSNLVARWLHCWIMERNNRTAFVSMAGFNDAYRSDHTVLGADYNKEQLAYTTRVKFDTRYINKNVGFKISDLYAYPVAAPQGAAEEKLGSAGGSRFVPPIHNLINPDDYVPQVAMSWFGFERYSNGYDHDVTGSYPQGGLNARTTALGYRMKERVEMSQRLNAIQPGSGYAPSIFRQRFFSKAGTVGTAIKKGAKKVVNFFKKVFDEENDPWFDLAYDTKGEGNRYVSRGVELAGNQGKYFEEFMRFFAGSFGVNNRQDYVNGGYQESFELLCRWLMGLPSDQMAKLDGLLGSAAKKSLDDMLEREKITLSFRSDPLSWAALSLTKVPGYNYLYYLAAGVLALYGKGEDTGAEFVAGFFNNVLNQLNVSHTSAECRAVGLSLTKIIRGYFSAEQDIAKLCFFHTLTLALNVGEIGKAHWPALYLSWYQQAKPATASRGASVQNESDTASLHESAELAQDEHAVYIRVRGGLAFAGVRHDGDIIGTLPLPESCQDESVMLKSWHMVDASGATLADDLSPMAVIGPEYPKTIYLIANEKELPKRHVVLWSNLTGDGAYEQDVKIAEFDVYDGAGQYITNEELPEGFDPAASDVVAYRDALPAHDSGLHLDGWTLDDDTLDGDEMDVDFYTTDTIKFADLPELSTVNLYGVWVDSVSYGIEYHANRGADDTYVSLEYQVPSEGQILLDGFEGTGQYPQLEGKSIVGWNSKADGTGTSYRKDQLVEPQELGLATREEYINELNATDLNDDAAYNAFVNRHTVQLFAQWGDAKNGWSFEGGSWYYYENGAPKTGWVWDSATNGWYHFGAEGAMDIDWTVVDGKRYRFNPTSDGTLGKALSGWQHDEQAGVWRYLNPLHNGHFGEAVSGWLWDGTYGSWFWFDADHAMARGWRLIDGHWYLFGQSGRMLVGWQKVGDAWYYLQEASGSPRGACAINTVTPDGYRVDENGAWIAQP